jgi:hypothetical protein
LARSPKGGETIFPMEGGRPHPRNNAACDAGLKVPKTQSHLAIYGARTDGRPR